LTSAPVKPEQDSALLTVPRWSALIEGPRVPFSAASAPAIPLPPIRLAPPTLGLPVLLEDLPTDSAALHELTRKARRALQVSYWREAFWIAVAGTEIVFLLFWLFR
jgi:hypothetical protein